MKGITWTEDLSVGVKSIDGDHKYLFSLINRFIEAIETGGDRAGKLDSLEALIRYTKVHFHREEALMEACNFPGLEVHRSIHQGLAARVLSIRDSYAADPETINDLDLLEFLQGWLLEHIMKRDMEYSPYMAEHRVEVMKAEEAMKKNPLPADP